MILYFGFFRFVAYSTSLIKIITYSRPRRRNSLNPGLIWLSDSAFLIGFSAIIWCGWRFCFAKKARMEDGSRSSRERKLACKG